MYAAGIETISTIVTDGSKTGRKNAFFNKGTLCKKYAVIDEIVIESIIISGIEITEKRNVFFNAS